MAEFPFKSMGIPAFCRLLFFCVMTLTLCLMCFWESAAKEPGGSLKARARSYYYGKGAPQDYSKALSLYRQAAQAGDPEAQYIAGGMYFKGMGTPVDYTSAFELLYKAALSGKSTVESQRILGQSFLLGRGVPKNFAEARHWYNLAAAEGDREAQNELAFMYFVGNGVEQDYEQAYEWFQKAARGGLPVAQYNVGIMLYSGNGVPESDLVGAYAWFSLAASNGHAPAGPAQQSLESILSKEQLEKAQMQARDLYLSTGPASGK
jgi:TPR repeat protein